MGADPPTLLVLAGHDPTGGAGVDADREAAEAHGARAVCVVTAHTDQDGVRVSAVRPRDPQEWLAEARAAAASDPPGALKSGLLAGTAHVLALVELAREHADVPLVVDPVLAASGGEVFLDDAGIEALLDELVPLGPILTPNLPEAARLTGLAPEELVPLPGRVRAAELLIERGASAVALKGGHSEGLSVHDVLVARGAEPFVAEQERRAGSGLHGSGCRYASALAAGLAVGFPFHAAGALAGRYVGDLIEQRAAAERAGR